MPPDALKILPIPVPIPFRPGTVNAYRVSLDDGGWMLIDGGPDTPEAWEALNEGIRESGGWDGLRMHFVTHMHIDHVGLARRIELQARCPLVMGELDGQRMIDAHDDADEETAYRLAVYREAGVPPEKSQLAERAAAGGRALSSFRRPDRLVPHDGRLLDHAPGWRTVWTPGHTAGHTALFREADGALIVGDAVLQSISATIGINRQRNDPVGDSLRAFAALQALPILRIYPGHGDPFDEVDRIAMLAEEVREECRRVEALLDPELRTVWEIAHKRYRGRELPMSATIQAVRETFAHLTHLAQIGRVRSTVHSDGSRRFRSDPDPATLSAAPTQQHVFKVALTGNIAAGKSAVARVWREHGVPVIEADQLARDAVAPGTEGLRLIVERWGEGLLGPDGELDRTAMRELVFADDTQRIALERIVHPAVERLRRDAIRDAAVAGEPLVVADIPLLFEVGLEADFDAVVLVDAPESVRLQRIVENRGLELDTAQAMIDAQWPAPKKRAQADYVIDNEGTLEQLEQRAMEVLHLLRTNGRGGLV